MTEEPPTPNQSPSEGDSSTADGHGTGQAPAPAPESSAEPGEKRHVFDDPENVKKLLKGFFVCCVLLLPAQFLVEMHGHFKWEGWFGFYAFYGLVSCILLVLISKFVLRPLVMRDEHYYDDPAPSGDGGGTDGATEGGHHA